MAVSLGGFVFSDNEQPARGRPGKEIRVENKREHRMKNLGKVSNRQLCNRLFSENT